MFMRFSILLAFAAGSCRQRSRSAPDRSAAPAARRCARPRVHAFLLRADEPSVTRLPPHALLRLAPVHGATQLRLRARDQQERSTRARSSGRPTARSSRSGAGDGDPDRAAVDDRAPVRAVRPYPARRPRKGRPAGARRSGSTCAGEAGRASCAGHSRPRPLDAGRERDFLRGLVLVVSAPARSSARRPTSPTSASTTRSTGSWRTGVVHLAGPRRPEALRLRLPNGVADHVSVGPWSDVFVLDQPGRARPSRCASWNRSRTRSRARRRSARAHSLTPGFVWTGTDDVERRPGRAVPRLRRQRQAVREHRLSRARWSAAPPTPADDGRSCSEQRPTTTRPTTTDDHDRTPATARRRRRPTHHDHDDARQRRRPPQRRAPDFRRMEPDRR